MLPKRAKYISPIERSVLIFSIQSVAFFVLLEYTLL